jgi:hypothetical protein
MFNFYGGRYTLTWISIESPLRNKNKTATRYKICWSIKKICDWIKKSQQRKKILTTLKIRYFATQYKSAS